MKLTVGQLQKMVQEGVRAVLAEAKRKKKAKGKKLVDPDPGPAGYVDGGTMRFDAPQGRRNLYKRQGASNAGPFTAEGLRRMIAQTVREQLRPRKPSR